MTESIGMSPQGPLGLSQETARSVGHRLAQARFRSGFSVRELSRKVRIREHFIAAIEEGNWQNLPPGLNGRGLIRLYARELKVSIPELDPTSLLPESNARVEKDEQAHATEGIQEQAIKTFRTGETRISTQTPSVTESPSVPQADASYGLRFAHETPEPSAGAEEGLRPVNDDRLTRAMESGQDDEDHLPLDVHTPDIASILGIEIPDEAAEGRTASSPIQDPSKAAEKKAEGLPVGSENLATEEQAESGPDFCVPTKASLLPVDDTLKTPALSQVEAEPRAVLQELSLPTPSPKSGNWTERKKSTAFWLLVGVLILGIMGTALGLILSSEKAPETQMIELEGPEQETGDQRTSPEPEVEVSTAQVGVEEIDDDKTVAELGATEVESAVQDAKSTAEESAEVEVSVPESPVTQAQEDPATPQEQEQEQEIERIVLGSGSERAELMVLQPVIVQLRVDGKVLRNGTQQPALFDILFSDRIEIFVQDGSKVSLKYGDWDHGVLGRAGRRRKLVLEAQNFR